MRVKFLKESRVGRHLYAPGEVGDLIPNIAAQLCTIGTCVPADPEPIETATKPKPAERAVAKRERAAIEKPKP